nr:phosphate ABC transporter permease PstA [Dactylosporangium thailandense]
MTVDSMGHPGERERADAELGTATSWQPVAGRADTQVDMWEPTVQDPPAGAQTVLPRDLGPVPVRRALHAIRADDAYNLLGSLCTGVCVAVLLFAWLAPFSGFAGFVIVAYAVFIAAYAVLSRLAGGGPEALDRVWTVILGSAGLVLLIGLLDVVGFTLWKGLPALWHLNFFTEDLAGTGPRDSLERGGVLHAVVGTLEMISIALLITIPLGLACAVYLTEIGGRGARLVRTIVEAMTALPSIVAGLFIYATLILIAGFPSSGFAAACAISVMMLPIIIRAADVVLRLVPGNLREASEALGAPRWRTVWYVVLPTARSGLLTSIILGTARGIGETSPVLLTAGYTVYLNADPFSGPQVSLPLLTFQLVRSGEPLYQQRGFGAAALLMVIVVTLFALARAFAGRPPGRVGTLQARRNTRRSAEDLERMRRQEAARHQLTAHDDHESYPSDPGDAS